MVTCSLRKIKRGLFFLFCFLSSAESSLAKENDKLALSLSEAILLAVRDHPNVQSAQLNYALQKFNLYIQKWQFYPHYAFQASATYAESKTTSLYRIRSQTYNMQPSVSLLTPIGTQLSLTESNTKTLYYNPGLSFQVLQPLLRGFGRPVVEAALNNAKDTEAIARLNIEGTLRNTVSTVITAYLDLVFAEQIIKIDQDALARAEQSVQQTKLFIKAGHKAGNELVTVQANVASAKSQLENDKNNLEQARNALLTAIGIDPNTNVKFTSLDLNNLIKKYRPLALSLVKQLVLENDIQYQTDQITLHGSTTRALLVAEDNTRWQLNFTVNALTGNATGNGQNAGMNSLFNGFNHSENAGLTLQIPINDQLAKQAVMNAKVALKQADLALMQEKWNKETSAINGWNLVSSANHSLRYAEDAQQLQAKTYQLSYQKYLHGLIDSLELQSAQLQLIQAQQSLLAAQINYIKALVNLDLLIGNTLKTWDVKVRI